MDFRLPTRFLMNFTKGSIMEFLDIQIRWMTILLR